jgi:hypothetical protein
MRFYEFKPITPLDPKKARLRALQLNVEKAKQVLSRERALQQQQRAMERQRKQHQKIQRLNVAV